MRTFPSISPSEFEEGCRHLAASFESFGNLQLDWSSVRVIETEDMVYLSIHRTVSHDANYETGGGNDIVGRNEIVEDDEEALNVQLNKPSTSTLEYNILRSPTYGVPVLYFVLHNSTGTPPFTLDTLHRYIIPEQVERQVEQTGVLGAITMTDHPVSNLPTFFVHPCNTSAALEASAPRGEVLPEQYLQLWIGIIGGCVGLRVPFAIASRGGNEAGC